MRIVRTRTSTAKELAELGSIAAITAFVSNVVIAPSIVVGRMRHERLLDYRIGNKLR
jgi:hypothetical protein